MIEVSAFGWVPDFAAGLVRDTRVRWALEEAGLSYRIRRIDQATQGSADYRALQPFGQVPAFREDGLALFESGAIVLHIAARSPALMPDDAAGRARATAWVLAALNSVEIMLQPLAEIDLFHATEAWTAERRPQVEAAARRRLAAVADWLGGRDWLEDRFTIGDLMMASVLRVLRHTDLVTGDPRLGPYLARCEARPAFHRAIAGHMADLAAA